MRLNRNIQIHEIAGEKIAMLHEKEQMTRVISFNETALFLWNSLIDIDFDLNEVVNIMLENYEVDEETARNDASVWVKMLQENGMLA